MVGTKIAKNQYTIKYLIINNILINIFINIPLFTFETANYLYPGLFNYFYLYILKQIK